MPDVVDLIMQDHREQHLGDTPDSIRKSELERLAGNIGLEGASGKDKSQLQSELAQHADE